MVSETSWPYAPTFCTGVPPTVPGIPLRHSRPGAVGLDRLSYKCVPIDARTCIEDHASIRRGEARHIRDADLEHQAGETGIGNDEVAAAAQDEQWQVSRARELNCLNDLRFALGFGEIVRRAADAKRGERS